MDKMAVGLVATGQGTLAVVRESIFCISVTAVTAEAGAAMLCCDSIFPDNLVTAVVCGVGSRSALYGCKCFGLARVDELRFRCGVHVQGGSATIQGCLIENACQHCGLRAIGLSSKVLLFHTSMADIPCAVELGEGAKATLRNVIIVVGECGHPQAAVQVNSERGSPLEGFVSWSGAPYQESLLVAEVLKFCSEAALPCCCVLCERMSTFSEFQGEAEQLHTALPW